MKKVLLIGAVLISSLGAAQSRLTIAEYVANLPPDLVYGSISLKGYLGDLKKSGKVETRGGQNDIPWLSVANKDLANDYLDITITGGDLSYYAYGAWRSSSSKNVMIGGVYGGSPIQGFDYRLEFIDTADGKTFDLVTEKIMPVKAIKAVFSACKQNFENAIYKIPQRGTSIAISSRVDGQKTGMAYNLDWNSKARTFVLGKGTCK